MQKPTVSCIYACTFLGSAALEGLRALPGAREPNVDELVVVVVVVGEAAA